MVCQILDLVSGVDVDAMTEIACFQLLGSELQCADWNNHVARHQHTK